MIDSGNVCSDDDPDDVGCWMLDSRQRDTLSHSVFLYSFFFGR